MTTIEASTFIHTVLRANWPKWEFSDEHEAEWAKRLKPYDFGKARKAVNDFAFRRTRLGIPPAGNLFTAMKAALLPKDVSGFEPIHTHEIVKEGNARGYRFAIARRKDLPKDPQEMEDRANRDRDRLNELFKNTNWIILQRWQRYYEEAECPI